MTFTVNMSHCVGWSTWGSIEGSVAVVIEARSVLTLALVGPKHGSTVGLFTVYVHVKQPCRHHH